MKRSSVVVQRNRWPKQATGLWSYVEPYRKKGPHKNRPIPPDDFLASLREIRDQIIELGEDGINPWAPRTHP